MKGKYGLSWWETLSPWLVDDNGFMVFFFFFFFGVVFAPDCFITFVHPRSVRPSIRSRSAFIPLLGPWGLLESVPADPVWKSGCTLDKWPPVHHRATTIDALFRVHLELPVNPVFRSLDCGRKAEFLERSHTGTLPVGIEPTTLLTRHLLWATGVSTHPTSMESYKYWTFLFERKSRSFSCFYVCVCVSKICVYYHLFLHC